MTTTSFQPIPKFNIHPQIICDSNNHKKSVLLPYEEWEQILEIMEEFDEIQAYESAKAESDEFLPFEQAVQEIFAVDILTDLKVNAIKLSKKDR